MPYKFIEFGIVSPYHSWTIVEILSLDSQVNNDNFFFLLHFQYCLKPDSFPILGELI